MKGKLLKNRENISLMEKSRYDHGINRYMKKGGQMRKDGELTALIGKNLTFEGYDVIYDHGVPGDNVGELVSTIKQPYKREDELSQLDIAIVEKSPDRKYRAIVLVEIEETSDRPKTIMGDIFGFLFGEHIFFKRQELQVGEFTTLIVAVISKTEQMNRNEYILDRIKRVKSCLGTQNAQIGNVVIEKYTSERELSEKLPSKLKSMCAL